MKLSVSVLRYSQALPQNLTDVMGFVGMSPETRKELEAALPQYTFFGMGTSAQYDGMQNAVAFRSDRFALHGFEHFWLSDTPHIPGSRFVTDQTDTPRCCTAALLIQRKDYKVLRIYLTETDTAPMAQVQGVSLILSRMAEDEDKYPGSPAVLMGDFHDAPGSKTEAAVTKFAYRDLKLHAAGASIYTNLTDLQV